MTTDLWMLACSAILCIATPYIGIAGLSLMPGGLAWGVGNRDTAYPVPAWIERNRRAHANMVENLLPFAVLVLVAHASGKADATTAMAARMFFVARVAYTGIYLIGIPVVRTMIFGIGLLAEILIFTRLLA